MAIEAALQISLKPLKLSDFAAPCHWLQTSLESGFVRVPVCHRHLPGGVIATLRALTLTTVDGERHPTQVIHSSHAYAQTLSEVFGLQLSDGDCDTLWQQAARTHAEWMAQQTQN